MLPFMKPRSIGAVMIHKVSDDGKNEPMHEEGSPDPGLVSAMEDLHSSMQSKDVDGMAEAFKSAFEIMQSLPSDEGME